MRSMAVAALLLVALSAPGFAVTAYSGTLTGADGGLMGTGPWVDRYLLPAAEQPAWMPATLTWHVTQNADFSWHYEYVLNVYEYDVSHLDIQTSTTFTSADMSSATGDFGSLDFGEFMAKQGSPGMPAPLFGIRFDEVSGHEVRVSFDSVRTPVWGDFYAKGGRPGSEEWNSVWNAGFMNPDYDPSDPPSQGSVDSHLLVPDTIRILPVVPEPTGMLALGMGLMGMGAFLMRRRR